MGFDPDDVQGWQPMKTEDDIRNFAAYFFAKTLPEFSQLMLDKVWLTL